MGFNAINFSFPSNAAEWDQLAGKDGACFEEACDNYAYRCSLAEWRHSFLHGVKATNTQSAIPGVEQLTGIKRLTEVTKGKTKDLTSYAEKESTYLARVLATVKDPTANPEVTWSLTDFAATAQFIADSIKFDPTEAVKGTPKSKISKEVATSVAKLLAEQPDKAVKLAAVLSQKLGRLVEPTADGLGFAITEDIKNQNADLRKQEDERRKAVLAQLTA